MTDKLFDEARILYELFTKSQRPVDKDTLDKLSPLIGLSHGTDELLSRLHRMMSGLPAEDELMAIAIWMEQCKLIHKLDEEQFPPSSRNDFQVPDLYAVFDHDGEEIPVYIEVKATNKSPFKKKLRFTERLYTKMTNYAKINDLPLLIAWKIYGHWVLFGIREMKRKETAYHIDLERAMKADLMYSLMGNINISPMPGVGFSLILRDLGLTGHKSLNGEEHKAEIHGIRVSDKNGIRIDKMNTAEWLLFLFADKEEHQHRHDDLIEITYSIVEKPSMIPAYALLAFMLFGMRSEESCPSNWYEIINPSC